MADDMGLSGLDELDERIVQLLRRDPRRANREMAELLGVSQVTVANRIRGLAERKLVMVTAQEDIWSLGYDLLVLVDVFLKGRSAEAVAFEIAKIEQVGGVSVTMTSPEIILQVFAKDREDLMNVIENHISAVPGVVAVESLIVLDALKYQAEYGELDSL